MVRVAQSCYTLKISVKTKMLPLLLIHHNVFLLPFFSK